MTWKEIKRGMRVSDRWFLWWEVGVVERVLKTRVRIRFSEELRVYDRAHTRFLQKESR